MRIEEFDAEQAWWGSEADGFAAREQNEFAWHVGVVELQARNWNLDCKNPHVGEQVSHDPDELLSHYDAMPVEIAGLRDQIGTADVCTPVTNAHLVCRLLVDKKARRTYQDENPYD